MKYILIAALSCISMAAQASTYCASNTAQNNKIQNLIAKVDVFGTWKGTYNGDPLTVVLSKKSNGDFSGQLSTGKKNIGPTGVQICEYNPNDFALIVYFQTAPLRVISSTQVEITLPFDGNPKVIVTKSN